jgi:uncharacterized protein (TIGR00251 family)
MDIPHKKDKDGIIIHVKVKPLSSKKALKIVDGILHVSLTARPVEGEANKQLLEILSEFFNVKKSDIIILRGSTSRNKLLKIKGVGHELCKVIQVYTDESHMFS